MIHINSIKPNYAITKDNCKELVSITVEFEIRKKTVSSGDSITLQGTLSFPSEYRIDLNTIQGRIISNLKNLFTS